jgi:hypothetical protein
MTLKAHHDPMTDAQRDESSSVVRPTFQSGEHGAQNIISDLRGKAEEHTTLREGNFVRRSRPSSRTF